MFAFHNLLEYSRILKTLKHNGDQLKSWLETSSISMGSDMSEVGKSMYDNLIGPPKTQSGRCKNCGSPLELFELDFKKSQRIMKCTRCGMLHFYKKDIIGKWRIFKAQKPDLPPR